MRKIASLLFFLSAMSAAFSSAWAAEDALFKDAGVKYQAGQYKEAVSLYRKLIDSGKSGVAVYYNLGNASFRAGDKAAALIAFERAHALDPRDRDVEWNKTILQNTLPDRIEDSADNVFVSSVQKILEWVTMDEIALVFTLLLALFCLISALNFSFHRSKSLTSGFAGFLMFLWILSAAVFYFKWLDVKDSRVVVLDREVAARYGPSDKETKAFVLHEGAEARVVDQTDSWYYIRLQNKNTGWILKKSCEII